MQLPLRVHDYRTVLAGHDGAYLLLEVGFQSCQHFERFFEQQ